MKFHMSLAAAVTLAVASASYGVSVVVDSTAILNPNPSNLTITEVGNTGQAAARLLITGSRAAGRSGVVDFQQQAQGGTFPNSTAADNGLDFANGSSQPLLVTAGSTAGTGGLVAMGPTIFSFYRLESTGTFDGTTSVNGVNNFDSNLNQGGNIISGGYLSRYPGAVSPTNPLGDGSAVTGTNPNLLPTATIGGAYIGINNQASPATMVFNTSLSFFGLTALPRGAVRDTVITLTEVPVNAQGVPTGAAAIAVIIGQSATNPTGAQVVGGSAVFFGQTANPGFTITQAVISNPNALGPNRYDDLAFVTGFTPAAVPEPTTLAAVAAGSLALLRRRRSI